MQTEHLAALAAVLDHGTFEAAARHLGITPSAVSQRIKALEAAAGRVVVTRTVPCAITPGGEPLLRLARQYAVLLAESRRELGLAESARRVLRVAVNADSLSTWFPRVFDDVASWGEVDLQVVLEDQEHTLSRLRSGDVLAAVASSPVAPPGCRAVRLGALRYVPVAAPALLHRFPRGDRLDWSAAPMLRFNVQDSLQSDWLARRAPTASPPLVEVPDVHAFEHAVRAGLGWGMLLEAQLGAADDLVRLASRPVAVPLHWHTWAVAEPLVRRLTEAVERAAPGR